MSSGNDSPGRLAAELAEHAEQTQGQEEEVPNIDFVNALYDDAQAHIQMYEQLRDAERSILRWQDHDHYIGNAPPVSNILATNYEGAEMDIYALRDRNFLYNPGNTLEENTPRINRYGDIVDNLRRFMRNRFAFNQVQDGIDTHKWETAEQRREIYSRLSMAEEDSKYQQQQQRIKQQRKQKRKKELQRL